MMLIFVGVTELHAKEAKNKKNFGTSTPQVCNGNDCFITIQNNCNYEIYAFYSDSSLTSPIPLGGSNNNIIGKSASKTFISLSQYKQWNPNTKIFFTAGNDPNCKNDRKKCIIGSRATSTLFEFDKSNSSQVVYDISLVDGFDFPMSVQVTNLQDCQTDSSDRGTCVPQSQFCGPIHTGTLNVKQCDKYQSLNYSTVKECSDNSIKYCARWAEYTSDAAANADVVLDCLKAPNSGTIIGCSAPNKFGTSLKNASCSSQLPNWMKQQNTDDAWNYWGCQDPNKCIAQPQPADCSCSHNTGHCSLCKDPSNVYLNDKTLPHGDDVVALLPEQVKPNAVNTTYYKWVKTNTFYGTRDPLGVNPSTNPRSGGVYAFAKDDLYSQYFNPNSHNPWLCNFGTANTPEILCQGSVSNTCRGKKMEDGSSFFDKLKFKIIVGPQTGADNNVATGQCPELPVTTYKKKTKI